MSRVFSNPRPFLTLEDQSPNSAGKLYFREPGANSTTLKDVYNDNKLTVKLTNPIILGANGETPTIFLDGDYNIEETNSDDVTVYQVDNYETVENPAQYSDWDATLTYAVNDIVRGSDGNYYISLSSGNTQSDPVSSPTKWAKIFLITEWNTNKSYIIGEYAEREGELYRALTAHSGSDPLTSRANWDALTLGNYDDWLSGYTYEQNDIARGSDGSYYIATVGSTGTDPSTVTTPAIWNTIALIRLDDLTTTFNENDYVTTQTSKDLYISLVDSNSATDIGDTSKWKLLTAPSQSAGNIASVSSVGSTPQTLAEITFPEEPGTYSFYFKTFADRTAGVGNFRIQTSWSPATGDELFNDGESTLNDLDNTTPVANTDFVDVLGLVAPSFELTPSSTSVHSMIWTCTVTIAGSATVTVTGDSNDGATNIDWNTNTREGSFYKFERIY